jgi:hypothetical protein
MRPEHLLRLYPPGWRARYGEEFLATLERRSLRIHDVVDVLFGALDAWLSMDVRNVTASRIAAREGGMMSVKPPVLCRRESVSVTPRDALVGATVMLVGAFVFKTLARASTATFPMASHVLTDLAFLGPFTLSMPFWLMKGQPWKAQTVIVGGTLAILLLIG